MEEEEILFHSFRDTMAESMFHKRTQQPNSYPSTSEIFAVKWNDGVFNGF